MKINIHLWSYLTHFLEWGLFHYIHVVLWNMKDYIHFPLFPEMDANNNVPVKRN